MMALNKRETRDLYRKRAQQYDASMWLYRLVGFPMDRYRRLTVNQLQLEPGSVVVDLGCGTGLNFPFLQRAIGEGGSIIGVDLTDSMLDQAQERLQRNGWKNVELTQADLAGYQFPPKVDAILSTFAITLVPEYDQVIQRGSQSLKPGGRMAIFDIKEPDGWPEWLIRFAAWLNKPYGVSLELADRHPWESIRNNLNEVFFQEYYSGIVYLSVGEAP